ncbi:MAG: phosphotransferase family protein, partial [Isosphaeraceae bacterium]
KQCRERLRVAMEWLAPLDRIWTESATLGVLGEILPAGTVPLVLFEERPDYLFAMTCAADDAVTWKTQLLSDWSERANRDRHQGISVKLGELLGTIHEDARSHAALRGLLADTSLFEELRVDPYYRTIARRHPSLAGGINSLIADMDRPLAERTLVLGDFSPKNILVHAGGLVLLDFECAHAGDAAFDIGFFLTHLILKEVRASIAGERQMGRFVGLARAFWASYQGRRSLEPRGRENLDRRAARHTAACCLARVDGKSPVEYLDERGQSLARSFACGALAAGSLTVDQILDRLLKILVSTGGETEGCPG